MICVCRMKYFNSTDLNFRIRPILFPARIVYIQQAHSAKIKVFSKDQAARIGRNANRAWAIGIGRSTTGHKDHPSWQPIILEGEHQTDTSIFFPLLISILFKSAKLQIHPTALPNTSSLLGFFVDDE